jgi:hypothetical protein
MKLDLICTRKLRYPAGSAGKEYVPGDAFKALSERDAKVLVAVGRAKESAMKARNKTDLPKVAAEPRVPLAQSGETPAVEQTSSRQYNRRDLTAEE